MNNLIKLSFALFLGVVAAGANWVWVSSKAKPPQFVAAKTGLKVDRTIDEEDLIAIPVPGTEERLKMSLIPYENRAILFGVKASRDYEAGDIFFQRDIRPPAEQSQWDVVGPFRLISVGARFKEPNEATESYGNDSSRNNVTIEVSADFDQRTRRLLEVIRPRSDKTSEVEDTIVAVQVVPSRDRRTTKPQVVGTGSVYQTVSLEGLTNVPRVLLAGDMIRFVVPARTKY